MKKRIPAETVEKLFRQYANTQKENARSFITDCPSCGQSDKFYMFKDGGHSICHHPSCEWGSKSFQRWLSVVASVEMDYANSLIWGDSPLEEVDYLELSFREDSDDTIPNLVCVDYPTVESDLTAPESKEALFYIKNRGIQLDLAIKHGITYNPWTRRVILPVFMGGQCYGWQGRAIDSVKPGMRMRNNEGFNRASLLMFIDTSVNESRLFVLEGPFDALKFDGFGGYVATMGKVVTESQIELMINSNPSEVYIGLDEDAAMESNALKDRLLPHKDVYFMRVPKSCVDRCAAENKKADFGECNSSEISEAIAQANRADKLDFQLYFKGMS